MRDDLWDGILTVEALKAQSADCWCATRRKRCGEHDAYGDGLADALQCLEDDTIVTILQQLKEKYAH